MVIFYVYMCERAKKSPFYVAYTQIGNLRIGNLRMQREKLRKPSFAYMRMLRSQRNHSLRLLGKTLDAAWEGAFIRTLTL